jgi:hypothetical protein
MWDIFETGMTSRYDIGYYRAGNLILSDIEALVTETEISWAPRDIAPACAIWHA